MCYYVVNLKKGDPNMDQADLQARFEELKFKLNNINEQLTDDIRPLMKEVVILAAQNELTLPFLTKEIREWLEKTTTGYFTWSLNGWW